MSTDKKDEDMPDKASEDRTTPRPSHPVDRGWAWVILAGIPNYLNRQVCRV